MASIDETLRSVFRLEAFRPRQREIIADVLAGVDVVCVMPTGAGKSLCFQLPAVAGGGLTLIVSPLISLMADQVRQLRALGVKAMYLNSSQDPSIQRKVLAVLETGWSGLLYIAPERFTAPAFQRLIERLHVTLFVVDEAHCVSFWGHDFRPEYMQLANVRKQLGSPVTMAVTATATPQVRTDIVKALDLRSPKMHITGFDRPNLAYGCRRFESEAEKDAALLRFLKNRRGSGIVYCATRRAVEELAALFEQKFPGRPVTAYHAGLGQETRSRSQRQFMAEPEALVVATNAFGMGINKPDIRFVVHYHLPGSIEQYYQEAGRAGRDGAPANCVLYFRKADLRTHYYFIDQIGENNTTLDAAAIARLQANARRKLSDMLTYATAARCRRRVILEYFGQPPAVTDCGCDVCRGAGDHRFAPDPARAAALRESGAGGRRRDRPTFSDAGADHRYRPEKPAAWSASPETAARETRRRVRVPAPPPAALDADAQARFEALRKVRMSLAKEHGWPAFCILHDRTLHEVARAAPASVAALAAIKGVGEAKAEKFGPALLAALKRN